MGESIRAHINSGEFGRLSPVSINHGDIFIIMGGSGCGKGVLLSSHPKIEANTRGQKAV